jgi:hypothetical protein
MKVKVSIKGPNKNDEKRNFQIMNNINISSVTNTLQTDMNLHNKQNKISSQIKVQNRSLENLRLKENVIHSESLPEITNTLLSMGKYKIKFLIGYSLQSINLAYNRYKFKSIDHAVFIMGLDTDTGYYHHQFYLKKKEEDNEDYDKEDDVETDNKHTQSQCQINTDVCTICNDIKQKHYDYNSETIFEINRNTINNSIINETHNNLITNDDYKDLEELFKGKDLCSICYVNDLSENSIQLACDHIFCKECLKNYLEILIRDSKVDQIKCLQVGCKVELNGSIVKNHVNNEYFKKYLKFTKRLNFLENLKRGYVPCTFPDCEEWVGYKEGDDPFLECSLNHKFCAKCKEEWHKVKDCKNVNYIINLEKY